MGKRQKRINSTEGYRSWEAYVEHDVTVISSAGGVYHGKLLAVDSGIVRLNDLSGKTLKLVFSELKEMIVDFVSR
jgi:hypothetical protein